MGKIHTTYLTSIIVFLIIFTGCKKEDYFARPADLSGPMYQQLEAMGNFTHYLELLDRTEYAQPLKTGGSWTVFAPTDSAFEIYLEENGYTSVADMPARKVKDIVQYSLIIDMYNTTTLTYYPSGWYAGNSFRKYTNYQDTFEIVQGSDYPNFQDVEDKSYLVDRSMGRRKTTNYWVDEYIDSPKNAVEREDYPYMFTGKSVMVPGEMTVFEAKAIEKEIVSENGMIYGLDKVLEPKEHLYDNLTSEEYNDKYSIFKSMLDRFGYFRYSGTTENPYTGTIDSVYYKMFYTGITSNRPAFNIADEVMPRLLSNVDRTESNAVGLTAPTNDALLAYLNGDNELARNYESYDDMPLDVLGIFLNMNFFTNYWNICPSHFGITYTTGLEEVELNEGDVVDTKFCSNGLFVGINKVFPSNTFATVYGPLVLDTTYSLMLSAVKTLGLDDALQGTGINFSIFGLRNNQFVDVPDPNSVSRKITVTGFEPDMSIIYMKVEGDGDPANNREYPDRNSPSKTEIDYVKETLEDIVLNQIVEVELTNDNYYLTKSGEFIYYSGGDNKVQGGGDIFNNVDVSLLERKDLKNGQFYVTDKYIDPPNYYAFYHLIKNIGSLGQFLYVLQGAGALQDIPGFSYDKLINFLDYRKTYTLLVPNNAAIMQAIADGEIPNPSPAYLNGLDDVARAQATQDLLTFAKRHFIQHAIPIDGHTSGTFKSLEQIGVIDLVPQYTSFTIDNDYAAQELRIYDASSSGQVASKTGGIVNVLTKRVVLHEIDTYLKK